ncbi:hypothetical protein B0H19DRAFT_1073196 [Mycena capillaripes]|nr:hypothetical protein B0H19DRAFT_1073196 [Mycena capillaripes]
MLPSSGTDSKPTSALDRPPPAFVMAAEYNQAKKIRRVNSPTIVNFSPDTPLQTRIEVLNAMNVPYSVENGTLVYYGAEMNYADEYERTGSQTTVNFGIDGATTSASNVSQNMQGVQHHGQNRGHDPNAAYGPVNSDISRGQKNYGARAEESSSLSDSTSNSKDWLNWAVRWADLQSGLALDDEVARGVIRVTDSWQTSFSSTAID